MKLAERPEAPDPYLRLPELPELAVASTDIAPGVLVPARNAFDAGGVGGENLSPQLSWSNVPDGTKSFAVTCFDADAPTPSGFWHWLVVDLPADCTELPTGAAGSAEGRLPGKAFNCTNDHGEADYAGPGPPPGDRVHNYYFAVHALSAEALEVDAGVSPALVGFLITVSSLARGVIVAPFQRAE